MSQSGSSSVWTCWGGCPPADFGTELERAFSAASSRTWSWGGMMVMMMMMIFDQYEGWGRASDAADETKEQQGEGMTCAGDGAEMRKQR